MNSKGINCVFHYLPLHSSPYGQKVSRTHGDLDVTEKLAQRIVRLPLWVGLEKEQEMLINEITKFLNT